MDRIEAIRRSLRCFTLGLLGLIPLIGIPVAFLARREFHAVRREFGRQWNPARKYLLWGAIFSYFTVGLVAAVVILVLLILIANLTFR